MSGESKATGSAKPQSPAVTVTIDGHDVETEKGRMLIDLAEEMGIFIPRFCYHPGMKSVAVCRMCLVKVEGQKKLLPACATPADDGMKVETKADEAVDAQTGMLEFLLINHPLDCPICDRAGECPLQDQTYAHGPGSSRYIEPKRTYEKDLEISDLVVLDRERCVLCWRCVRFCDEIAGDSFIELVDRGPGTQILTFNDEPFNSYFSGNTIQICPVGALLSKPYRFVSRPWNLETAPSVCSYCAVGCPMSNESRAEKVVRCQALPNEQVNDFWICDKGRFGYHHVSAPDRLTTPLIREGSDFRAASWGEALSAAAEKLRGKDRVGVIAGGHLTTEDAYALARLARGVIATPHIDSRIQDEAAPYELALRAGGAAGSTATYSDLEDARSIVWAGPDPKETLPVLFLRLRKAVLQFGAKLTVVSPRAMSLDVFAADVVRCEPGGEAAAVTSLARRAGDGLEGPVVACWGPSSPGRSSSDLVGAVLDLVAATRGRLLMCPPHAGSQGLIDMGVHPALAPGYVSAPVEGRDTRGILEGAAAGELEALLIVGADPLADFPDRELARRALSSKTSTIVCELFPTETVGHADVVFPSAAYAERSGTFTNLERRLQKLEAVVPPPGSATEPWKLCERLADALGEEWGWSDIGDVWTEITRNVATHRDVDLAGLAQQPPAPSPVYESGYALAQQSPTTAVGDDRARPLAGPGAQYPKGFRSGAPFQTGQNWPLSWELRAFEAKQRPGHVPPLPTAAGGGVAGAERSGELTHPPDPGGRVAEEANASADASGAERSGEPAATPSAAAPEQSSFALYTGRMIYDEGAMVSRSAALRGIQRRPFVELNAADAERLGLSDGDEAVVRGAGEEALLRVVAADIARGAVFIPYDQQGLRANRLMSGRDATVEVSAP